MAEIEFTRPVRAPAVSVENARFWEAAARGELLIKRCEDCHEPHFHPRAACPFCYSQNVVWEQVSGEAVVYAFTVVRRSPTGPYAAAYVELKEGPRIMTNIVGCPVDDVRIGQSVKVVFQPAEGGGAIPMFAPA